MEALEEQVRDGAHTLLTAQRRMGKTSLVRALLRRLGNGEDVSRWNKRGHLHVTRFQEDAQARPKWLCR